MAEKTKEQLAKEAEKAGLDLPEDATKAEIQDALEPPPFEFDNAMASEPIVAPDGHVVLSQEDIDARD